jgi:glycosidase
MADMTHSTVPEDEWLGLKHLGIDMVWLVGVWLPSPESERIARGSPGLLEEIKKISPDFTSAAIGASPYSVFTYKLNPELGFEWELKALREKLNSMGMKLIVDFVSNHSAKDNPYIDQCPDCFVRGGEEDFKVHPEWFFPRDINGVKNYIAYGRDPNFPAWTDTAQLNYFNPATREKMLSILMRLAEMSDGVRCDMVMLTLNDVYENTWGALLGKAGFKKPEREFWGDAIKSVKEKYPEFVFLGEVYWGLEWRVQQMDFDYTYDKITYDRLRFLGSQEVKGHLRAEKLYQKRSVRFIDNHDEQPSITTFGREKALAAGVIISTIKGLRLYHENQLNGLPHREPLQLKEIYDRVPDLTVRKFYEKLLKITDHPAFHGGEWNLLEVRACSQQDDSNRNMLAWSWMQRRTMKIVVVNYSGFQSCGIVNVPVKTQGENAALFEEISDRFFSFKADEVASGLKLQQMPPYCSYIFDVEF